MEREPLSSQKRKAADIEENFYKITPIKVQSANDHAENVDLSKSEKFETPQQLSKHKELHSLEREVEAVLAQRTSGQPSN